MRADVQFERWCLLFGIVGAVQPSFPSCFRQARLFVDYERLVFVLLYFVLHFSRLFSARDAFYYTYEHTHVCMYVFVCMHALIAALL
jgi:hypothetical protein